MENYCSIERRSPRFDAVTRSLIGLSGTVDLSRLEFDTINTPKSRKGSCALLERQFLELIQKDSVDHVFDIGANNGRHTKLFLAQTGARVHSFEPNPAMFENFIEVVGAPRLSFNPFGLSNSTGLSRFEVIDKAGDNTSTTGMSSFEPVSDGYRTLYGSVESHSQVVAHCAASQYLETCEIPATDRLALWIDVEGHAPAVIEGFGERLAQARVVLCEIESIPLYTGRVTVEPVIEALDRAGLTVIDRDFQYFGRFNLLAVHADLAGTVNPDLEGQVRKFRRGLRDRAMADAG